MNRIGFTFTIDEVELIEDSLRMYSTHAPAPHLRRRGGELAEKFLKRLVQWRKHPAKGGD